jgi:hypothetical protein
MHQLVVPVIVPVLVNPASPVLRFVYVITTSAEYEEPGATAGKPVTVAV